MARIPRYINDVKLEFAPDVKNEVHPRVVEALFACIPRPGAPPRLVLHTLWIHSASDQHSWPSRHSDSLVVAQPMFKAVDISRVNGIKIDDGYRRDPVVRAVVDSIQTSFESFAHRRENFGPLFKKKLGAPYAVPGHSDHIHLSVN